MNEEWNVLITCKMTKVVPDNIILDGQVIGKIGNEQSMPLILSEGKHIIQFKALGGKTKPFSFVVDKGKLKIEYKRFLWAKVKAVPIIADMRNASDKLKGERLTAQVLACPSCGAIVSKDLKECEYCKSQLNFYR